MQNSLIALVVGLSLSGAASIAAAGPSTHELGRAGNQPEGTGRGAQLRQRDNARPYQLTGERRAVRREIQWRDVPQGRGQIQRLPFWVTVAE